MDVFNEMFGLFLYDYGIAFTGTVLFMHFFPNHRSFLALPFRPEVVPGTALVLSSESPYEQKSLENSKSAFY